MLPNNTQVSSNPLRSELTIRADACAPERVAKALAVANIYLRPGHFEYPVSELGKCGNHLDALFLIDPIVAQAEFVATIAEDIRDWMVLPMVRLKRRSAFKHGSMQLLTSLCKEGP
jgi:hypothetical protein